MVFRCRCFSFPFLEEEEEIDDYETTTQPKSTSTQTFYTASSDFNQSLPDSQAKALIVPNLAAINTSNLRVFTFAELKAATKNFNVHFFIGEGGFGTVFYGVIKSLEHPFNDIEVAVKCPHGVLQGQKEWVTEVNVLGVVQHPNVVKLLGYCAEDDERSGTQRLLVYEYMLNGSVDDHLYTISESESPLSWSMRLKVAQDAARGLAYLHEHMDFQIIFRDFKSSNILLDDEWNAKLSDFGLAHLGPEEGRTHVSTTVVGTMGYMAPEYLKTGHLRPMCDVWSYGVFLFELITARRRLDVTRPVNEYDLLEWVAPYLDSKKFHQIIDPRLQGNYSLESVQKLSFIANKCLTIDPKCRPKMSEVLEMVNQLITVVPSQAAANPAPPLRSLTPVVAIEPKNAFADSIQQGKKTNENMKSVDERGSKDTACLPRICCVS